MFFPQQIIEGLLNSRRRESDRPSWILISKTLARKSKIIVVILFIAQAFEAELQAEPEFSHASIFKLKAEPDFRYTNFLETRNWILGTQTFLEPRNPILGTQTFFEPARAGPRTKDRRSKDQG